MATSVRQLYRVPMVDRREAPRRPVADTRVVTRARAKPIDATLLDLSIYGCRLATAERHETGEQLWLRLNDGAPVAARVVWSDGARIGCRFDEPIPGSLMREFTRTPG